MLFLADAQPLRLRINPPVVAGRMIIVGSSGDEDDDRRQRGRGGAPPRPAQQPLSTDLANIVNAATSANNPRHPADLVRVDSLFMLVSTTASTHDVVQPAR